MDYGCEMQLLQDGAQLQLQLQPEEFVAIADYTATDETQVSDYSPNRATRISTCFMVKFTFNDYTRSVSDCSLLSLTNHPSRIQRPAGWWGSISLLGELGVEPPDHCTARLSNHCMSFTLVGACPWSLLTEAATRSCLPLFLTV